MKQSVRLGLAVSSLGASCATATAQFRDYQVCLGGDGPFVVAGASSRGNPNGVWVEFSKPVVLSDATFTLNNGVVVNDVIAGPNPSTARLSTSPLTEGTVYSVSVVGAKSTLGEPLASGTAAFIHGAGYEQRRIHLSHNMASGENVHVYLGSTAYRLGLPVACQDRPDAEAVSLFEDLVPDGVFNEYFATRLAGILNITTAANYRFACASDDTSALFLSTDDDPVHKIQIAGEPQWNNPRMYAFCDRRTCLGGVPQE
ncbi:MAG TPA: hypothetical protein VJ063_20345, partial [Verrucomicrobiae bacterium]|nr:hypothetical protein [Verrucomicrobiae bacterium]